MPIDLDLYFPVFTVLQFFFFMGLLKVQQITQKHEDPNIWDWTRWQGRSCADHDYDYADPNPKVTRQILCWSWLWLCWSQSQGGGADLVLIVIMIMLIPIPRWRSSWSTPLAMTTRTLSSTGWSTETWRCNNWKTRTLKRCKEGRLSLLLLNEGLTSII